MQHLFQVASLDEVPREQLEELVAEYPSFGVARYLLSRKLRAEGDGHFTEETLKTNLYFSNPYWLQWLLENNVEKTAVDKVAVEKKDEVAEVAPAEPVLAGPVIVEEPGVEEELHSGESLEGQEFSREALPTSTEMATDESVALAPDPAEPAPVQVSAADDIMASIAALRSQRESEASETTEEVREALPTSAHLATDESFASDSLASIALEQAEEEETQTVVTAAGGIETETTDNHHVEETKHVLEVEEAMPVREVEEAMPVSEVAGVAEIEGAVEVPPVEEVAPQEVEAPQTEQGAGDVDKVGEALPTSADMATGGAVALETTGAAEPALSFQAFHTIDYFASQGIKLSLDENPSDKLGKQMKSFTDWLKTMRKLPQKNQQPVPDIAAEHLVRTSAAHSVEGKEVVTETMAEVLAKQGMREKATEVYRKLSLLNPDKSSYFANKIDQLKID